MQNNTRSVGLVPDPVALDGLTEIRVHGVGGTPPEQMLGDMTPSPVAGDRIAGFYRTSDRRGRHREAYSWGGLTSGSRWRVLWALLVPSMLANMAGWTARRLEVSGDEERQRPPTSRGFRWAARLAALALTVCTAALVAMFTIDTLAYQCAGQLACRRTGWLTTWLTAAAPHDRPGARLAVGAVVAGAVAALFFVLARRTRADYESAEPPAVVGGDRTPSRRAAAAHGGGLRSTRFWSGALWHQHLSDLHLAAGVAVVAGMLGWCVVGLERAAPASATGASTVATAGTVLALVTVGVVVAVLASDDARHRVSDTLLGAALAALVLAGVGALLVPLRLGPAAGDVAAVLQPPGVLPGMRTAVNVGLGVGLGLLAPLAVQQLAAWAHRWRTALRTAPRGPGRLRAARERTRSPVPVFPWAAPLVLDVVAVVVATTIQLSIIVTVADLLGDVAYGFGPAAGGTATVGGVPTAEPTLWVPPAVGSAAALLSLGLLGVLVVFAVGAALWWRVAARRAAPGVEDELRAEYAAAAVRVALPRVARRSREAWLWSAFVPPDSTAQAAPFAEARAARSRPRRRPTAWVVRVAGNRLLAEHSRDLAAILLVAIAGLGMLGAVAFLGWVWVLGRTVPMIQVPLGTGLAALLPGAAVVALRAAFRSEQWRRGLGSLFDVGSFFPRSFHPFAPPSYTERAVPELTRRVWLLHDHGGRVVITAHSQGSVLAAAVLGRESGRGADEPLVGLVTLGSPLAKLYRWAFPALLSDGFLQGLGTGAAGGIGALAWRNVFYRTDFIGGPVRTRGSVIPAGVDEPPLVDPPDHWYVFGQKPPGVLSHTGYWRDERFWRVVNDMCDRVVARPPATPPPDPPPGGDGLVAPVPDPSSPVQYL